MINIVANIFNVRHYILTLMMFSCIGGRCQTGVSITDTLQVKNGRILLHTASDGLNGYRVSQVSISNYRQESLSFDESDKLRVINTLFLDDSSTKEKIQDLRTLTRRKLGKQLIKRYEFSKIHVFLEIKLDCVGKPVSVGLYANGYTAIPVKKAKSILHKVIKSYRFDEYSQIRRSSRIETTHCGCVFTFDICK